MRAAAGGRGRTRPMVMRVRVQTPRTMHGVADRERVPIGFPVRAALIVDFNWLCDRLENRDGLGDRLRDGIIIPEGLRDHLRSRDHPGRGRIHG